jgi:hypothetical protein
MALALSPDGDDIHPATLLIGEPVHSSVNPFIS